MIDSQILTFAGIALVLTLTPGADTMVVIRNVIQGRKKAGVLTSIGICTGLLFHAFFSTIGLSVIILQSAELFEIVKYAGAVYLFYLGVQSLKNALKFKREGISDSDVMSKTVKKSNKNYFLNGMLTNILNPKVALFYLSILPQFIAPGDPVLTKSIFLGSIHLIFGLFWLIVLSFLVDTLKIWFKNSDFRAGMETLSGLALIGLGVKVAVSQR